MFSNLRQGAEIYVLHKNEPRLDIGEVISVTQPIPQSGTSYYAGYPLPGQKMVVDVKIKVGTDEINLQKLPADSPIADFGTGMVVSETRDSIIVELESLRKSSQHVIDSIDEHKSIIEKCETMIADLNPQAKQDAVREKEMKSIRDELNGFREDMADIKAALAKIAIKPKKEE